MVVVAIVALLIGLIVPSARAIQRESQNAGCMSNLRQDFIAIDSYRQQNSGKLPMCEFLPVVTEAGVEGGLPNFLKGFIPADSVTWKCPADIDEESLATGTSYTYVPGLLRYAPAVQVDVTGLLMSFQPGSMTLQRLNEILKRTALALGDVYVDAPIDSFVGADFVDNGHFSAQGARRFAEHLGPAVREACR